MSPTRAARAITAAVVPVSVPDLQRWAPRVIAGALCLAAALGVTAVRLQITRTGYVLEELTQTRDGLAAEVDRLSVEVATLSSAGRIEREALRLGMIRPGKGSIFVLDE